MNPIVENAT